jgi:hypothetical protein
MAYVNSGIEIKNTHYNWKMILVIALFLCGVVLLVILKLLNPAMDPQALFSAKPEIPSPSHAVITPKHTAVSASSSAAIKSDVGTHLAKPVVQSASTTPVISLVDPVVKSSVEPTQSNTIKSGPQTGIVCSAEDHDAQLCQ